MAETYLNISDQSELFNEYVSPGVLKLIAKKSKLWDKLQKTWKHVDVEGLYAKQKVMLKASQSTGASYDDAYPEAQQSKVDKTLVYIKRAQMFRLAWSGFALEAARKAGASMPPIELERQGIFITMANELSRQLMMDGSGRLCQLVTCGADPTTVVKNAYFANATKFLNEDMKLEVHTVGDAIGAGKAASSYDGSIYVDSITNKTTFELSANCSVSGDVDDYYFRYKGYAETEAAGVGEMMGLLGIISDADPPQPNDAGLQGLAVSAYPQWKSHVNENGGVDRDLTEDLFIQVLDEVSDFAETDVILVSTGVRRAYYALIKDFVTLPNQKALWGGWNGLAFIYDGRTIPVVPDKFVPDGHALFISEKDLIIHVMTPGVITWESGYGGTQGILQKIEGYNRFSAEGHIFANLGTYRRNSHAVLKDIKEPS